jgi:hypothetical protein
MQLLKFRIRETEHLPVTEREEILKRCMASQEMRRFKKLVPPICGAVPTAIAVGFFFMALFRWRWSFFPASVTFVTIYVVIFTLFLLTMLALKNRILRRLVRRELQQ